MLDISDFIEYCPQLDIRDIMNIVLSWISVISLNIVPS